MKNAIIILFFVFAFCLLTSDAALAQCSICTRTAQQLGEEPAKGLNAGILYLAFTPMAVVGVIGYNWWRKNKTEF